MAGNQSGGLGDFLRQLNDIAKDVGQALNQAGEVSRSPRPAVGSRPASSPRSASAPTSIPKEETSDYWVEDEVTRPVGNAERLAGEVRRNLGQTAEEREDQLRQHRQLHAKEQRAKQQKKEAFDRLQVQHRQEQQKMEVARRKKSVAGAAAGVAALRYAKFLKGKQKNVQDAVMLAEIIGPCRALKGWREF